MQQEEQNNQHQPQQQPQSGGQSYIEAASEMGSNAIKSLAPADKGWILAVVLIILGTMAILEITNYLENSKRATAMGIYLTALENNRSQENRRLSEQNRILANALSRQSDRISRKVAETSNKPFTLGYDPNRKPLVESPKDVEKVKDE